MPFLNHPQDSFEEISHGVGRIPGRWVRIELQCSKVALDLRREEEEERREEKRRTITVVAITKPDASLENKNPLRDCFFQIQNSQKDHTHIISTL